MSGKKEELEQKLTNVQQQLETAKVEVVKPFPKETELKEKTERLAQLNALLNMDEKADTMVMMEEEEPEQEETVTEQKEEKEAAEPIRAVASWKMSERLAEHEKNCMSTERGREKISIKEKLSEMREKINAQKGFDKPETAKGKGREEYL